MNMTRGPHTAPIIFTPRRRRARSAFFREIGVLLAVFALSACGPATGRRVAAVLDEVESYINEWPDSALAVLRALDSTEVYRGPAQRARASLLHTMALDKCYIDLQTDSIIGPAVDWSVRHGSADEKLKVLYYQGRIQYNARRYQQAVVTYTEALALADKVTDIKYLGLVNQAIADTYSVTYQSLESQPYLDRAYVCFVQMADSSLAKKTLYKKALSLTGQKRWEESNSLFEAILRHPFGVEDILPRIKADYALSQVLQDGEHTERPVKLFQDVLSSTGRLPKLNHYGAYAYALMKNGDSVRAQELFKQLETTYPEDEQVRYWLTYEKAAAKQYEEAFLLTRSTLRIQDSLLRSQLNHSAAAAQKEFFENKTSLVNQINRRKTAMLWLTLVLFAVFLLLGFFIARNRHQESLRERARLMLTVETTRRQASLLKEENEIREERLSLLFKDYFSTLGRICADYEEGLINHSSVPDRQVLRRIDRIVKDFRGDMDGHAAFEQQLNKHLNNIMLRFRKDFPRMKDSAYMLVSFIISGMDMQTISVLMGVDMDSLYARKYRVKTNISASDVPNKAEYLSYFG